MRSRDAAPFRGGHVVDSVKGIEHFGAQARVRYAEAFAPARFVWDLATVDVALVRT